MDIRDFHQGNTAAESDFDIEKLKQTQEFQAVETEYSDVIEKFLANYGKMSSEELLAEMLTIVAAKKKEGTFDANKIRKLSEVVAPFLGESEKVKMQNLLNFLD